MSASILALDTRRRRLFRLRRLVLPAHHLALLPNTTVRPAVRPRHGTAEPTASGGPCAGVGSTSTLSQSKRPPVGLLTAIPWSIIWMNLRPQWCVVMRIVGAPAGRLRYRPTTSLAATCMRVPRQDGVGIPVARVAFPAGAESAVLPADPGARSMASPRAYFGHRLRIGGATTQGVHATTKAAPVVDAGTKVVLDVQQRPRLLLCGCKAARRGFDRPA